MGDKIGRIHVGKQDLNQLQTRKMKGLKRSKDDVEEESEEDGTMIDDDDEISDEEMDEDLAPETHPKRARV